MTRDDTKNLLAIISSLYPNFKPDNLSATTDVWFACIKDKTPKDMQYRLMAFAKTDTSGFAPTIGQLLAIGDNEPSAEEEWARVRKAICNGCYHAAEEFEKLPPRTQAAIGSPTMLHLWALTDENAIDTSIAKQFKTAYDAIKERDKKNSYYAPAVEQKLNKMLETKGETNETV